MSDKKSSAKAFFTFLSVFLILHAGSHISLLARHDLAVSDYYLPTALSLILIQWVGPKYVLPAVFLNSVSTSHLWGNPVERWDLWFIFAVPETLFALLSWFLFRILYKGKYWLPDIYNTSVFLAGGVMIPAIVETLALQSMLVWTDSQSPLTFWAYVKSNLLSEITTSLCLTLPALFYITPLLQRKGYLSDALPKIPVATQPSSSQLIELGLLFTGLLILTFLISFVEYWYVYGLFSLFVAIRYGFGPAILTNLYILLITYVVPKFFVTLGENDVGDFNDVSNIFLGANFLFVFAAITGRVISDVKNAEMMLLQQNKELKQANEELDRFVYSVSHDLSAPLKSILGLINVSRLDNTPTDYSRHLTMIEKSVERLEDFISEILDYSRNKRTRVIAEKIKLQELCTELLRNLKLNTRRDDPMITFDLSVPELWQDKSRMKVIMNNLLSNAVIFQKDDGDHVPQIKIMSRQQQDDVIIQVEDNGVGIKPNQLKEIFKMFYRGHEKSRGSGLGLYIAQEAAHKINGTLSVESEVDKGSTFVLKLSADGGRQTDNGPQSTVHRSGS